MTPSSPPSTIRPLLPSDMIGAIGLTGTAGWNQLPSDWERLLAIAPQGCFALESDGRLAATTTVVCYGNELAWIGMVLTFPEFRRRGFAQLLIERALEFIERRGIATTKLDATEAGINLYRKYGFVEECEIERWQRDPAPMEGAEVSSYRPDLLFDRQRFGADRSVLLSSLAELGAATVPEEGYAMGRPGSLAAYFGPCVTNSPISARKLLRWFLNGHRQGPVFWDLLPANKEAVRIAQEFGFSPVRRLVRMVLSRNSTGSSSNHSDIYAIAGFELG